MTSQTRKQIITIHILPNISRRKSNQAVKFGQLTECDVRNTFFENHLKKGQENQFQASFCFLKAFCFLYAHSWFLIKWSGTTRASTTFCVWLFKKNLSEVIFYNWPNLHLCMVINFCLVCDVINFEIELSLLIEPFFYITEKVRTKI